MTALNISGLTVGYGRSIVVRDLDLTLESGRSLSILGRNGVGKTTLLNAIVGLLKPAEGSISLDGEDVTGLSPDRRVRRGLAYVPQGRGGFPQLTVLENLVVISESVPGVPASAVEDAIETFPRLKPLLKRPAGVLSGGQQQQLAIARALTTQPSLLLLDEPTEGIQPSIIDEIEDAVTRLGSQGMGVVLVEQFVDFALALTDDYIVMDAGFVVAAGLSADLEVADAKRLLMV